MHHHSLLRRAVFAAAAVAVIACAFLWREAWLGMLPESAQGMLRSGVAASVRAFHETFGMEADIGDASDGAVSRIAIDDAANENADVGPGASAAAFPDAQKNNVAAASQKKPASSRGDSGAHAATGAEQNGAGASSLSLSSDPALEPENISSSVSFSPVIASAAKKSNESSSSAVQEHSSCAFPSGDRASSSFSQKIIFNEIAWMGSPSSSAADAKDAAKAEWMEIKNNGNRDVDLAGWSVANASGEISIAFGDGDRIARGGFFVLLRASTTLPYLHVQERSYSGDLKNAGDSLALMDASCAVADLVDASANGWPAGDNATKQTMERNADGTAWHASANPGGTPGAENSAPAVPVPRKITVAFQGAADATITSDPKGMSCGMTCAGTYLSGTKVTLTPHPGKDVIFDGWSGFCYGATACSFTVSDDAFLTASFHKPLPVAADSGSSGNNAASTPVVTTSTGAAPPRMLVAAVQISGASSTNDFVKIYNAGAQPANIGGWKLRKRSQTGSEYSIREIAASTTLAPGKYFLWANSADGFAKAMSADSSSTETLAGNNSVALIDAEGNIIDALAWGTGTNQYGEGSPYPDNPAANQVLARKFSQGSMVDTGNNATDFTLQ